MPKTKNSKFSWKTCTHTSTLVSISVTETLVCVNPICVTANEKDILFTTAGFVVSYNPTFVVLDEDVWDWWSSQCVHTSPFRDREKDVKLLLKFRNVVINDIERYKYTLLVWVEGDCLALGNYEILSCMDHCCEKIGSDCAISNRFFLATTMHMQWYS